MSNDRIGQGRILIVDDNSANLGVLFNHLDTYGYEVRVTQDGESAIELLEEEPVDLILLDIMLPGRNGYEICRDLKATAGTKEIPVIFISALAAVEDKVEGFDAGGVDYITKPFQQEEVLARVEAHLTIKRQREKLAELIATRDRFFGIIAHDLRGPLGGFLNATELLEQAGSDIEPAVLKDMARGLRKSAEQTKSLLENLLNWALLQRREMKVNRVDTDLVALSREVAEQLHGATKAKGLSLSVCCDEDRIAAHCDRDMISTVVRNLVNNAVKFTDAGGRIILSIAESHGRATLEVCDNGVGMSDGDRRRLFRIDEKVQRPGTDGEHGTGLGLLLVRENIEQNEGTIEVQSTPGEGTCFRISLPAAISESQKKIS